MSLFERFFKVLSLYLESSIRIWIRTIVKGRIRIRVNVMRFRNTEWNLCYEAHSQSYEPDQDSNF